LLESQANLTTWTPLAAFNMSNGAVQYADITAANSSLRFYLLISP
jgi:hypothetical protein